MRLMQGDERPDQLVDEEGNLLEGGYGWRQRTGLLLGVVLLLATFVSPPLLGLSPSATKVAWLAVTMAVFWVTEALPIPATALFPLVLLPILGISPMKEAATAYADPIIYLFMGGFMLAIAMERWDLHRRIALNIIHAVGTKPRALILGFLLSGTFLSMWTSNSATAMMLLPIGISVHGLLRASQGAKGGTVEMGAALVLAIAYGANIGGMGTLIGTPPNAILKAFLAKTYGVELGFGQWMLIGVPLILLALPPVYLILTRFSFKVGTQELPGVKEELEIQRQGLGRITGPEWTVIGAFSLAIVLWVSREAWKAEVPKTPGASWPLGALLTDEVIAMGCASLLFFIPVDLKKGVFVLDWQSLKKLPWDVLVLFGGGLSLAAAFEKTQLVKAMASGLSVMASWPALAIVFLVVAVMIGATALTSNTATTTAFLPVIGALAVGIDQPAVLLCVPVAIAASADFALPVGTPPNAIAFGSGLVSLPRMVKAGLVVDLLFALLIPLVMWTFGRWAFRL
ncbi:SLC13 family permease [Verrucomicrobium spinosum]|uniref:SLC13 family permease n=2 Tax=Verrucomicrobium spinosum TaxID=2736 RepID=UPI0001745ED5|nr:SLC13 family permease [Verrucomicrobium spinosum]